MPSEVGLELYLLAGVGVVENDLRWRRRPPIGVTESREGDAEADERIVAGEDASWSADDREAEKPSRCLAE